MILKNSYAEEGKLFESEIVGNMSACRYWCGRGASPTSENLNFSTGGSVM